KVASGLHPIDGRDAQIDVLVPRPSMEHLVRSDGTLDFKTRDLLRSVSTDEILLVKRLPTKGEPGHSVFGKPISAKPGRDKRVIPGRNVTIRHDEDREIVSASCEGQLTVETGFSSMTVHVAPVLVIPGNVDFKTGNISFKGSVIVHGTIQYGFSVIVTGNLRVDGLIEAGTRITVGGDLDVGKGILGSGPASPDSQEVKVFGNMRALYAENAKLTVQGDVFLRSAMNCRILANGQVVIEKSLIGGELTSFHSITAGELGNTVNLKTLVSCGVSHTALNRLNLIVKILEDIKRQLTETEKNLHFVKAHPDKLPPDKAEALRTSLDHKVKSLREQINKLEIKKADLALVMLEETSSTISANEFHPGVVLTIRASRLAIENERSHQTYYQKIPEERIESRPYIPGSRKPGRSKA
ncbi:MAG TPA: FapA family protein, partial [Candidatus Ozemobacteraceae bacterium]|nr:FapA family protein [Candidatus Ozemobacteraceae bacterium]